MRTFTIIYVLYNVRPTMVYMVEIQAESHHSALYQFINTPGYKNYFIIATVDGPQSLIGSIPVSYKFKLVHSSDKLAVL